MVQWRPARYSGQPLARNQKKKKGAAIVKAALQIKFVELPARRARVLRGAYIILRESQARLLIVNSEWLRSGDNGKYQVNLVILAVLAWKKLAEISDPTHHEGAAIDTRHPTLPSLSL